MVRSYTITAILSLAILFVLGCDKDSPSTGVFPEDLDHCEGSAVPNQFIVHYKNGSRKVIKGLSRDQVLRQIVEPQLEEIRRVDYDRHIKLHPSLTPSSHTMLASNWALNSVHVEEAWSRGVRGEGSVVAIVDTGVDYNHALLKNQVDYNLGEEGIDEQGRDKRYNNLDDDKNGYVDDWAGYNFGYNDGDPSDSSFHGTHVAGIVAAETSADQIESHTAQGVAPSSKIIPIAFMSGPNGGTLSAAIEAMEYAALRGAHIINASWGGVLCAPSLGEKIRSLQDDNIFFVAAAGNRGLDIEVHQEFPASFDFPNQLTVGSIGEGLGMPDHSNYGRKLVHIFAPGVDVLSTLPNNSQGTSTGTSMATPFISGALALLKSHRPQANNSQLRQALLTGVSVNLDYHNASRGRLHLGRALEALEAQIPQ